VVDLGLRPNLAGLKEAVRQLGNRRRVEVGAAGLGHSSRAAAGSGRGCLWEELECLLAVWGR
jgi:hypothetical protein